MITLEKTIAVPETPGDLTLIACTDPKLRLEQIEHALESDSVAFIQGLTATEADSVMFEVASRFELKNHLMLQAALAGSLGHRVNMGKYFMSVNQRSEYHFIPPHSEGNTSTGMQLASFYCHHNTTDGGETLLLHVADNERPWERMREKVTRCRVSRPLPLSPTETAKARNQYRLVLPRDSVRDDDQVLNEIPTTIPGVVIVEALARVEKTRSRLTGREVYVYWDSVASIDAQSAVEFESLLRQTHLLKEPAGGLALEMLDNAAARRVWNSHVTYRDLFDRRITWKQQPGDFVIVNNLTWAHSANNWSPRSGTRKIAAAFA